MNTAAEETTPTRMSVADLIAQAVLALAIGIAIAVTLAAAVLVLAGAAQASERSAGGLLLTAAGQSVPAPQIDTEVTISVTGFIARARVRQTFSNPHADWYEGIYTFPLPENAAVDHLRMRVGERIVEGEIRERGQAKAQYERAKSAGQRSSLFEQERSNVFTTSVANIGPRETIVVEIEYQQTLRFERGGLNLRFPMVVGPRYIPSGVEDAARITPAVLRARDGVKPINPVRLRVDVDAGVPIAELTSASHTVTVDAPDASRRIVQIEGESYANKDFELAWTLDPGLAPTVALFSEPRGARHYGLLMVMPPVQAPGAARLPRETVFVIDTSGSMHGTSIAQAKEALELALMRLAPQDTFNVIEFNSTATRVFQEARAASADHVADAVHWVRELRAQGGTEMALALNLALDESEHPGRVRQVIFLTDGAVGNEEQLLRLIADKLGDSRLFTVGIGSAPNSYFMSKAASVGRGTFTYIGRVDEVKQKMGELFAKLESPVMKGVRVAWPEDLDIEMWPKNLPDLYAGEPVVVSFSIDRPVGSLRVSGTLGEREWSASVRLAAGGPGQGLNVLWAREKISSLMDELREGKAESEVRPAVIELALEHHLVSKYTSLVAVDKTPARGDAALKTAGLPTNLPEGWNHEAVFGELPRGATDSRFDLLVGALLLLASTLLWMRRRVA